MSSARGYGLLTLPILFWGLAPIIVEQGLRFLDVLPFLAYRFIVSLIIILPYIIMKKRVQTSHLLKNKWTYIVGFSQVWAITTQYLSQLYISPSISATIAYSYLIMVPFASKYILGSRIEKRHIIIVLIAIVGLLMITINGGDIRLNPLGLIFAVLSTIGFASYIVSTSRLINMEIEDADIISLFSIIITLVVLSTVILSLAFGSDLNPDIISLQGWWYIILLAVLSTVIAYIAYIQALKYVDPNRASVLLLLQIVVPFIIETAMGIYYPPLVYIGGLIIVFSSYFVIRTSPNLH